jgi:cyanophycin synthetase
VLEVARGGMLRRGLGVPRADAALITNVSHDHLGEYGIDTLDDLAAAKAIVAKVVPSSGRIVLGADSAPLVGLARACQFDAPIVWFSLDPDHPVLVEHRSRGGETCTVIDGFVCCCVGAQVERLVAVADIPLTFAGRARHNVANVLGVVGLARALALPNAAIVAALREFGTMPDDNPGRAHAWAVPVEGGEVLVLLDFAHNQAGLATMAELVGGLGRSVLI